jgi:hypothetical protein
MLSEQEPISEKGGLPAKNARWASNHLHRSSNGNMIRRPVADAGKSALCKQGARVHMHPCVSDLIGRMTNLTEQQLPRL